jgi:hypothetical protein
MVQPLSLRLVRYVRAGMEFRDTHGATGPTSKAARPAYLKRSAAATGIPAASRPPQPFCLPRGFFPLGFDRLRRFGSGCGHPLFDFLPFSSFRLKDLRLDELKSADSRTLGRSLGLVKYRSSAEFVRSVASVTWMECNEIWELLGIDSPYSAAGVPTTLRNF